MSVEATHWKPDPFQTDVERRSDGTLLLHPRGTLGEYPQRLLDWLEHWAELAPQRVLVAQRGSDGQWRTVNYREMLERIQRLAQGLLGWNLSAERPILILSGNSIEHLTLAFAAMWAGIPYCPVSPAYSHASSDLSKLRFVLDLLTPGMVAAFDTRAFGRALAALAPDVPVVGDADVTSRVTSLDELQSAPTARLAQTHERTGQHTVAKFLLTSGSTGQPKAVITTHRMLCSNAVMLRQAISFVVDQPPVLVDWLPWNHTFGGSHNVGLVLSNGGSLFIDEGRPTPAGIAATVRNLREIAPTVYFNVPKGFEMLAHCLREDASLRGNFYRRLHACFFAGASLSQHTWDLLDATSIAHRGVKTPMLSGLGATETGPSVTFTSPDTGRSGAIGLPAAGIVVKLAPVGQKLELRVRSPAVTPGYWRQPEQTAAAFDDEGFYRLGDAVRLLDESDPTRGLQFDGRIGEDFKLANGTWVSVGPLRAELIAALSPVAQDVVIAGLDSDYIAAVIIPDLTACAHALGWAQTPTYSIATHPELLTWLRQRLQVYGQRHPASSRCVRRALILPSAPSLDRGEITDKGSINQRAVLRNRADSVAALYDPAPPGYVIDVGVEPRTCSEEPPTAGR